jgi:hypothetical protein
MMTTQSQIARPQIPASLRNLDDGWGIAWRTNNAIRRLNARRTARFLKAWAAGPTFRRPVFIIGAPRSGTSLLFRMLSIHPELASLGHEGHDIWRRFHHPRKRNWSSDVIEPERAMPGRERRFAEAFIRARANDKPHAQRFVEKTPENSLRVPYVLKLFPDAQFVAIHRNPCAVVSSYIDGWKDPEGRFRAYYVPERLTIPDYPHSRRWCFALIPGWRELTGAPIAEIAFRQWATYVEALASARSALDDRQLEEICLDDLVESPHRALRQIADALDLDGTPEWVDAAAALARTRVNSMAKDARDWHERNPREMQRLLPEIARLAPSIGYSVDPGTGEAKRT